MPTRTAPIAAAAALAACICTTATAPAAAQEPPPTPPSPRTSLTMGGDADHPDAHPHRPWPLPREASRVPAAWDFEGRITAEGIILPFPRGWVSGNPGGAQPPREGFPFYNEPGYSQAFAHSGTYSFELPTRGGSTSAMVAAGLIPSMPGADYIAVARVRTAGLEHAKARLAVRYADAHADDPSRYSPVAGTERVSRAVRSEGGWTELRVRLPARDAPSYVQIELQLLQPEHVMPGPRRRHEALREDVAGSAFFDDVALFQAPRLSIRTNSPVNMVEAPSAVELRTDVKDLTGEDLFARVWVWDMRGELVDRVDFEVSRAATERVVRPRLPAYGWYRATLAVRNGRAVVGVESVDFGWFSPDSDGFSRDPTRFGVISEHLEAGELARFPEAVEALRVGAAAVSSWGSLPPELEGEFDEAVDALLSRGVELTFILARTPEELARAARLDGGEVLAMLAGERGDWLSSLTPVLSVYGERVLRWQIGRTAGDEAVLTARRAAGAEAAGEAGVASLGEQLREAAEAVRELVPSARLVLPWPADHTLDPLVGHQDIGLSALMRVGPGYPADSVGRFAGSWAEGVDTAIALETIDSAVYGRAAATEDLAKRAALAWEAGIERISLVKPWVWRADDGGGRVMPTPGAAVWRTVASALAGHDAVARLPTEAGLTVILGARSSDAVVMEDDAGPGGVMAGAHPGVLVGWSDRAVGGSGALRAYLGGGEVVATDLFGNRVPIGVEGGEHVVPMGRLPVIVRGVDAELLRFWSSLRIEPAVIPSRAQLHELELVVTNPWERRVTGAMRLSSPESWGFEPRVVRVGIDAGETLRVPVGIRLGVGEEMGERVVEAEVAVEVGGRRYGPIGVPVKTELGLEGVAMSANYRLSRGPSGELDRVIVTVVVTNEGELPLTLEAFARAPGHRSEGAPISELGPGESEAASFVFDDADETIIGGFVRAGVRELGGNGRLNRTLRVEGVGR